MIYEERRTVLRRGAVAEYRRLMLEEVWPLLTAVGARPLCLLSGLIGMPAEEMYAFAGYASASDWERLQLRALEGAPAGPEAAEAGALRAALARRAEFVADERVRLLHPSGVRPKAVTPAEDRRAVYGMRRFWIRPGDWPDFVRHSQGLWARIESQDARILGLFHDAAAAEPLEVTLLTGYHDAAHWDATRGWRDRSADVPADLWEQGQRSAAARNALTLRSFVCLMTAHWPERE